MLYLARTKGISPGVLLLNSALPAILIACMALSCAGSRYTTIIQRSAIEATELHALCVDRGLRSPLVQRGDSLSRASVALVRSGRREQGALAMDMASLCYHLAITTHEAADTRRQSEELRRSLSTAREQITAYEKAIRELEQIR